LERAPRRSHRQYADGVDVIATDTGGPLWPIEIRVRVGSTDLPRHAVGGWHVADDAIRNALEAADTLRPKRP